MMTYQKNELWCVYIMVEEKAIRRLPMLYLTKEDAQSAAYDIITARSIDERVLCITRYGNNDIIGGDGMEGMSW